MAFGVSAKSYHFLRMNSISLPVYQQLLAQLNQMTIRGNRHKMAVHLNADQPPTPDPSQETSAEEDTVVAFNILFERNNGESEWRLMTPLRFTE